MSSRYDKAPPVVYLLALGMGLFGAPLIYVLADFFAGLYGPGEEDSWRERAAWFAVGYAVLGALFGLLWPQPMWRWGVWLTALPLAIAFFFGRDFWVWLGWAAQTMLPACSAAHAAARLHFKYTEVD